MPALGVFKFSERISPVILVGLVFVCAIVLFGVLNIWRTQAPPTPKPVPMLIQMEPRSLKVGGQVTVSAQDWPDSQVTLYLWGPSEQYDSRTFERARIGGEAIVLGRFPVDQGQFSAAVRIPEVGSDGPSSLGRYWIVIQSPSRQIAGAVQIGR